MPLRLNPYIAMVDTAREALDFYASVFGGAPSIFTFGAVAMPGMDPDKVMHGMLETPQGFVLMVADTPPAMAGPVGTNVTVSLSGDDVDELRGWWQALSAGGTVTMPLEKQVWGAEFGMCTDRFGVPWMVNITDPG